MLDSINFSSKINNKFNKFSEPKLIKYKVSNFLTWLYVMYIIIPKPKKKINKSTKSVNSRII